MDYEPAVYCKCKKRKSPRWISWSIQIPERRYYACMRRRVGAFASSSTLGIEIFVEGICSIWISQLQVGGRDFWQMA